jgi:membrane fusion protein (multidrug efflux system)
MKLKPLLVGVVVALAVGLGVYALVKLRSPAGYGSDGGSADDNVTNIVAVQVGTLTNMTLHGYVQAYGLIDAAPATTNQPAGGGTLAAPTAGVVSKVNVVAGQQVEKGDVLVELNSGSATYDYAREEVARQEKLFAMQNTSLKNVQDAKAQLASQQVVAPVSGTVTAINVKPGQAVDSTTIVASVIDLNHLAVSAKIPETQAGDLLAGQEVQVLTDPPVAASLLFVSPAINPDDGTVTAWASLPPDSGLPPGKFVQIKIVTTVHTNCLAAPAASVVTDDDGNSTVALVHDNVAAQTPVQVGLREDAWVEVQATNLSVGDRVVTVGAYALPDKTQIQVQNQSDDTSATNSPGTQ